MKGPTEKPHGSGQLANQHRRHSQSSPPPDNPDTHNPVCKSNFPLETMTFIEWTAGGGVKFITILLGLSLVYAKPVTETSEKKGMDVSSNGKHNQNNFTSIFQPSTLCSTLRIKPWFLHLTKLQRTRGSWDLIFTYWLAPPALKCSKVPQNSSKIAWLTQGEWNWPKFTENGF